MGRGYPFYMAMGFPGTTSRPTTWPESSSSKPGHAPQLRRRVQVNGRVLREHQITARRPSSLGCWRKTPATGAVKPQLQNAHPCGGLPRPQERALRPGGPAAWPSMCDTWYKGDPITREAMQLKALEIAQEMNIPEKGFKASLGWCQE